MINTSILMLIFIPLGGMQQKTDRVHVENLLLTAVTHFSGGVNKFPGGARPYALCNTESLINEFTNKYIWFYNIFNAREA